MAARTEAAADLVTRRIGESVEVQRRLTEPAIVEPMVAAAEAMSAAIAAGGQVILFGNGGSAADATHIAAELVGRFMRERRGVPALSLTDSASSVTAIANDYGYERVFARQIEALGRPGDVAVGISTSGSSVNVVAGLAEASERGLVTVALTGGTPGPAGAAADIVIGAPSTDTARVQECHSLLGHILCELVEQSIG